VQGGIQLQKPAIFRAELDPCVAPGTDSAQLSRYFIHAAVIAQSRRTVATSSTHLIIPQACAPAS